MPTTRSTSDTPRASLSTAASNPIKLPKFWKRNAALWFVLAEAQLAQHGIATESAKLFAVIVEMDEDILTIVSDIVLNPSATAYKQLKERLIDHFAVSQENRIKELMSYTEIGDKMPSQLLREMRVLAKSDVTDDFLKTIWLQRLPTQMQAVLTVSSGSLEELAKMADRISDTTQTYAAAISATQTLSQMEHLHQKILELTTIVDELKIKQSTAKSGSRRDQNNSPTAGYCYFHTRFGVNARKCRSPCNFRNNSGNILPGH